MFGSEDSMNVSTCLQEGELVMSDNSAQIFNALSDVPGDVQDVDELIQVRLGIFVLSLRAS